jgi:hypothetical protein
LILLSSRNLATNARRGRFDIMLTMLLKGNRLKPSPCQQMSIVNMNKLYNKDLWLKQQEISNQPESTICGESK